MPRSEATRHLRRVRRVTGTVLGEGLHAVLLALGVMVLLVLLLNGFNAHSTALFVENYTGRMLSAEPDRQRAFTQFLTLVFGINLTSVLIVRWGDRMTKRRARHG
ncbi:hypothetical protein PB2503_00687 [Parvularcula bermudensis HTCC2503]|uniref:Uncharacterized protein n=1 Tax=Parvularcula bermudensis (strain ATCC BAA-594 / HTCC2503 / KCTC 12087) TaxID=314260 RepID=E0TB09_PARBH|nr:hypothetical protein [Parvularcula bermudensis]ADM08218.1 hypothetical protein PB2503_00687 [Parvularcula bermudensis HTCC2503]